MLRLTLALTCWAILTATGVAAPRDVQFRTVDFQANTLELFNFGAAAEPLDGWRFCTHDDNQTRRYTSSSGLNGVSIDSGASLIVHFDNDASGPGAINISSLGGSAAGPFDRGPYGLGLYWRTPFGTGANIADHLQWSIDGVDNTTADERSDEAEGEVWTDQDLWVATTPTTLRLELIDLTGAALHGPGDYSVIEPGLAGDYNNDGIVNAEDYARWRENLGAAEGTLPNDTDGGVIGGDQYATWRTNFGAAPAPAISSFARNAAPEPSSLTIVLTSAVLLGYLRCPSHISPGIFGSRCTA